MEKHDRYESHYHIFTMEHAIKGVKSLLRDILIGNYPCHELSETIEHQVKMNWKVIKTLIKELYKTIPAVCSSEQENIDFLRSEAKKVFPGDNLKTIPLMIEVYRRYASPLYKENDVHEIKEKAGTIDVRFFQECWNEILDDFRVYLYSQKTEIKLTDRIIKSTNLEKTLHLLEWEKSVSDALSLTVENAGIHELKNISVTKKYSESNSKTRHYRGDYPFVSDYYLG